MNIKILVAGASLIGVTLFVLKMNPQFGKEFDQLMKEKPKVEKSIEENIKGIKEITKKVLNKTKEKVLILPGQEKETKENVVAVEINKDKAIALVKESMIVFDASIKDKKMDKFYQTLSPVWKKEMTAEELNEKFSAAIKSQIDLSPLEKVSPVLLKESRIIDNKKMYLVGFYDVSNAVVKFEEMYDLTEGKWKLSAFFINIQAKKSDAGQKEDLAKKSDTNESQKK